MRMNRRNVLVGLGTIVAGGGAALGTGAFSSVEATRTVSISTADDSSAQLAIEVNDDYDSDDSEAEINFTDLNGNAITTFDGMVAITNQGTNEVGITIKDNISDIDVTTNSSGGFTLEESNGDSELAFEINDGYSDQGKYDGVASSNIDGGSLSSNTTIDTDETVVFDLTADFADNTSVFEGLAVEISADVDDA